MIPTDWDLIRCLGCGHEYTRTIDRKFLLRCACGSVAHQVTPLCRDEHLSVVVTGVADVRPAREKVA